MPNISVPWAEFNGSAAWNSKLMAFLTDTRRAHLGLRGSSLAMELGLVSLRWFSSCPLRLDLALWFLESFPFLAVYNLLVLLFIFILGFKMWGLSKELRDVKKSRANLRTGYCSNDQTCNGFDNGDEGEGGGVVKSRRGTVKRRKNHGVGDDSDTGFRTKGVCCCACESKIRRWKSACRRSVRSSIRKVDDEEGRDRHGEEGGEGFDEDREDNAMRLRGELVKEKKLRASMELELEKERIAACSAADEAMAKILLLQTEKGLIEREAQQFCKMAEQYQAYHREIIDDLKWIILNLQGEK